MKRNILHFVLLCIGFAAKGQIDNDLISGNTAKVFQTEIPAIVINTDILLTGEHLFYKVYNLLESGKTSVQSKISYVSLRTDKDSVIFAHKLKLENGTAYGSFFIPAALKTGKYKLLSYTNFSLNNETDAAAHRSVYIINPFIKSVSNLQKDSIQTKEVLSPYNGPRSSAPQDLANDLSIKTNKPSYKKREKITISIENPNGTKGYGNYALSVRRVDPVEVPDPRLSDYTIVAEKGPTLYIPELRGEIISGKVLTLDNEEPAANKIVALSIPGKNYVFKTARTNSNGQFFISIDEPYETKNSIIQINEPNREQYKIALDQKSHKFEKEEFPTLKLDTDLKDWLQERSVQLQIANAYFKQDSIVAEIDSGNLFYEGLGTEFKLDDYTRFPSLEETFAEVITLARIREKNGKDALEVFDPYNPYKEGSFSTLDPLLLLDGILVQDNDDILSYSAREIESIRVFPQTYRYGPKVYRGIIDFKTKGEVYKPRLDGAHIIEFELTRPLPEKKYSSPDYSSRSHDRIPDYRTQLCWEPNIELSSEAITKSIYASDVAGTYLITLEGYTNNGQHVFVEQRLVVE